jgi:predicted metalloprotease with PDZ domain
MAGDEVIAINGIAYKDITNEQESEYYKQDALFFDIIRNGEPMQITVPVDKTEVQGD